MKAVILAGGRGKRLRPLTDVLPKPLLPIAGKPVLERILSKFKEQGIEEVFLTVNYMKDYFKMLFGDGNKLGLKINYLEESKPLGTAGPIRVLNTSLDDDFFVMNGDLVTDFDITKGMKFHKENNADLTIITRSLIVPIEYGVISGEDKIVTGWVEKPKISLEMSTGMYFLNPRVIQHIPSEKEYNMNELVKKIIDLPGKVIKYVHEGEWIDIGKMEDYERANDFFEGK
jgi:NDP-sugar pyrophosphorylase family protein